MKRRRIPLKLLAAIGFLGALISSASAAVTVIDERNEGQVMQLLGDDYGCLQGTNKGALG